MNTRALNQLADVICRAQKVDRTPMGIAFAIESAGLLMSPETAAELATLRARVAEQRPIEDEPIRYTLTPAAQHVTEPSP